MALGLTVPQSYRYFTFKINVKELPLAGHLPPDRKLYGNHLVNAFFFGEKRGLYHLPPDFVYDFFNLL
jgi:hypothetical protein